MNPDPEPDRVGSSFCLIRIEIGTKVMPIQLRPDRDRHQHDADP
jgi:hypothetical protein